MKPEILKKLYMKNTLRIITVITFVAVISIFSTSCKKDALPKATIKVIDETGEPVEEAKVIIKPIISENESKAPVVYLKDKTVPIQVEGYTQSDGKISYEFKYEVIYRVEVEKTDRRGTKKGTGALKLLYNKTVEETIRIN